MEKLYTVREKKERTGAECDSDHELLIAKCRLKLKKVGKTTRPFRHDLSQITCDSTVDMTNKFKVLGLVDKVPEEIWMEIYNCIVQEAVTKTIPKEKKCKKAKWLSQEALQIAEERSENQGKRGEIYPTECRVPENSKKRRPS